MNKPPFFIIDNFLSPMECEDIVERSFFEFPNTIDGKPIKSVTQNLLTQNRVLPYLEDILDDLEDYFGHEHGGILPLNIECYPQNCTQEGTRSENSLRQDGKWLRINDHDFTGIIFLKDSTTEVNFDDLFEVYGSKLQFPTHGFGFMPQRGQLIIFPSAPNFLNATISPKIGDLYQIRFHMVSMDTYHYDMAQFPGSYKTWFK